MALLLDQTLTLEMIDNINKAASFPAGWVIGGAEEAGQMLGIASDQPSGCIGAAEIVDERIRLLLWVWQRLVRPNRL
jgi:hypothetical protein